MKRETVLRSCRRLRLDLASPTSGTGRQYANLLLQRTTAKMASLQFRGCEGQSFLGCMVGMVRGVRHIATKYRSPPSFSWISTMKKIWSGNCRSCGLLNTIAVEIVGIITQSLQSQSHTVTSDPVDSNPHPFLIIRKIFRFSSWLPPTLSIATDRDT